MRELVETATSYVIITMLVCTFFICVTILTCWLERK